MDEENNVNWEDLEQLSKDRLKKIKEYFESILISSENIDFDLIYQILDNILENIKFLSLENINHKVISHLIKLQSVVYDQGNRINLQSVIEENNIEKESNDDESKQENTIKPDIIGSPYLEDLKNLYFNYEETNLQLKKYLNGECDNRRDVRKDLAVLKECLSPEKIPKACWPEPNDYFLSLAQQFGVNISTSLNNDIFSINGPPGTGKTTLLRDIIANALYARAEKLSAFSDPKDVFSKYSIKDEDYQVESWGIDISLFGNEIVVATSNNKAAENITVELPDSEGIKKSNQDSIYNDYFSCSANRLRSEKAKNDCWGLISAALGSKQNIRNFFKHIDNIKTTDDLKAKLYYGELDTSKYEYGDGVAIDLDTCDKKKFDEWRKFEYRKWIKTLPKSWSKEVEFFKKKKFEIESLIAKLQRTNNDVYKLEEYKIAKIEIKKEIEHNNKKNISYTNNLNNITAEISGILLLKNELQNSIKIISEQLSKIDVLLTEINLLADLEEKLDEITMSKNNLTNRINRLENKFKSLQQDYEHHAQLIDLHKSAKVSIISKILNLKSNKQWTDELNKKTKKYKEIYDEKKEYSSKLDEEKYELSNINKTFTDLEKKCLNQNKILKDLNLDVSIIDQHDDLIKNKNKYSQELEEIINKEEKLINHRDELTFLLREISTSTEKKEAEFELIQLNIDQLILQIESTKALFKGKYKVNFVYGNDFWEQEYDKLHFTSPWICEELQNLRNEIFWSSIRLHKLFVLSNRSKFIANLKAVKAMLTSKLDYSIHRENLLSIYNSLFCLVPVISTTFHSFNNMFKYIGTNNIGWLLVDEGGMTPPQQLAGAINKSNRIIVVGDPLQLEPIVTLPKAICNVLREKYNITSNFSCRSQSAQTLTDRSNSFGTEIQNGSEKIWVGSPLIVHRRCNEPMFGISNSMAYGDMMLFGSKNNASNYSEFYKKDTWYDTSRYKPIDKESHWIKEEGELVFDFIKQLSRCVNIYESVFIISPFSDVIINFKKLFYSKNNTCRIIDNDSDFLSDNVGTIHTFQGKQIDLVIILLGGNINKSGAISWASDNINMLNVAITRAKLNIAVFGNYNVWSDSGYFSELPEKLRIKRL
jgi:superfamily I DNA and/or RNA helicase